MSTSASDFGRYVTAQLEAERIVSASWKAEALELREQTDRRLVALAAERAQIARLRAELDQIPQRFRDFYAGKPKLDDVAKLANLMDALAENVAGLSDAEVLEDVLAATKAAHAAERALADLLKEALYKVRRHDWKGEDCATTDAALAAYDAARRSTP